MILLGITISSIAQDNLTYQKPPDEIAKLMDAPLTPTVLFSPDKSMMILLDRSDYPTIEELSRPELRIAGLRINPNNFGQSRNNFFIGIKIKSPKDQKEYSISNHHLHFKLVIFIFHQTARKQLFYKPTLTTLSFGWWI